VITAVQLALPVVITAGYEATLVKQILGAAKATDHLLTEDEVQLIIKEFRASGGGDPSSSATSA